MTEQLAGYDAVLLDLDGTVLRGAEAVSGAPEVVTKLRRSGMAVQFITNNAARSPDEVAKYLTELGVRTSPEEVLTSGQAAVALLADQLPSGAAVLIVGTQALTDAVQAVGLKPVRSAAEQPAAVLQGHSAETGWAQLAEACLAIRSGALWVACNIDRTLPTERGLVPGNGAMVAALQAATDQEPTVAGKPARPLLDTAVERIGAQHPLVVGDRLDTDIAGATSAGLDSLLVLSGVADAAALLAAPPEQRPGHVGADIRVLCESLEQSRIRMCSGWRIDMNDTGGPAGRQNADDSAESANVDDGDDVEINTVILHGNGTAGEPLDALRTLCAAWWATRTGPVQVRAGDDQAAAALEVMGLSKRRPAS